MQRRRHSDEDSRGLTGGAIWDSGLTHRAVVRETGGLDRHPPRPAATHDPPEGVLAAPRDDDSTAAKTSLYVPQRQRLPLR